ncbi:hypothetical protein CBR_g45312 [Chara braunii]|uniref:Lipoyl-binding domain-containing protein n=1 Tax=Chara braunii TaxID=69332 RepID=A0A388LYB5_CHABU|nr:hypothetical protein CBR_g45312 [Chara braunii]|eukprot:GBG87253.1 hypothetical protein CBR_g45312 [Chara braunii]
MITQAIGSAAAPLTLLHASPPAERKLPNPETILPAQHALEEKEEVQGTAVENCDEPSTSGIAVPSPFEVQSLLMQLCDETSIAELSLKVGDFQLRVLRDVNNLGKPKKAAYQVPISAPHVPGGPMMEAMESPASANGKALSLPARPMQSFEVDTEEEEDEVDEGLLCVLSPKVGVFRRGRFVKGKRGRPMVVEGQMIKTGQVIGYLEQLGTQQPIEVGLQSCTTLRQLRPASLQ